MAEKYGWCKDLPLVDYREKGKHYCVFHTPQGKKGILVKEFNELIFKRIKETNENELRDLSGTIFEGDISFSSQFDKDKPLPEISFFDAIFSGEASFSGTIFNKNVNFQEARFDKNIYFFETIFKREVNFSYATFSHNAFFEAARFSEKANFQQVIFNKMAVFNIAKFQGETDFSGATFNCEARFLNALFSKKTFFSGATFSKKANFQLASFSSGEKDFLEDSVSFLEAVFDGEADFSVVTFFNMADFQRATFSKKAYFSGPFYRGGDFIDLKIKEKVRFKEANLEKISFLDTDLRKIDFIDCTWPKEKNGRRVLYDEIELFRNKNGKDIKNKIEKVEILYRQLKQKCKEEHNEFEVSNWHYGEKEMQRKGSTWKSFSFYLLHLYWLSSGYGERPVRAGIALSLLIIIIAVLFGLTGIKPITDNSSVIKIMDYLKATIEYATFESKPNFIPENWFLKIAAKLLIPLQAALFALALRNRFRR